MKQKIASAILLVICCSKGAEGYAQEQEPKIGVHGYYGTSRISGDLASEQSAKTFGTSVSIGRDRDWDTGLVGSALGGLNGYLSIDFKSISTTADTTQFPFVDEQKILLFSTSISPNICAMSSLTVQACLGLGWEQIEVRQNNENYQAYGTSTYFLSIGRLLSDGLQAGLKMSYTGVHQTVSKKTSGFDVLSLMLSVGWQFSGP